MKELIQWDEPSDDPTYDWCGKYRGKWVDLVYSYTGTWSFMFDTNREGRGFETREAARLALIAFITKKEDWPN